MTQNFSSTLPRISYFAPVRFVSYYDTLTYRYYNGPNNDGFKAQMIFDSPTVTFDYNTLELNDRVLVINQNTVNGIYDVIQVNPVVILQRSDDFDSIEDLSSGNYVFIQSGYLFAGACFTVYDDNGAFGYEDGPIGVRSIKIIPNAVDTPYFYTGPGGLNICGSGNDPQDDYKSVNVGFTDTLTDYRYLSITMGDANRSINLSNGSFYGMLQAKASWAGGSTTWAYTLTGVAATDAVFANIVSVTNPAVIKTVVATTNTVTITFDVNPGATVASILAVKVA